MKMKANILKKRNEPYVDQSLETTRSIEYQLLDMKKNLESLTMGNQPDIDLAPAVTHTLETLQQIDMQLQSMRAMLEEKDESQKRLDSDSSYPGTTGLDKPNPPPSRPISPPTFPPTYPSTYEYTPPKYPYPYPHEIPQTHEQYYPPPPFFYDPYFSYYRMPYYYQTPPAPYYGYPPQGYEQRYSPYGYPPQGHHYRHPPYGYPPQGYSPQRYPPQGYPSRGAGDRDIQYYESAKPASGSSEPAYSSKTKAIPSQIFNYAYYPWEFVTGKKSPMSSRSPYVNLYDLGKEYLIYVELPGVERDNIDIRVDDQSVWINGKPTIGSGEEGHAIVQEHGFHEFSRQIYLPSIIIQTKTSCDFENGILKILLIKEAPKKPKHKVKIK
jgi:HSP20 family molecular chaperone IbpA